MASPRGRARPLAAALLAATALVGTRRAEAGKNDLQLLNLCTPDKTTGECSWVKRDDTEHKITSAVLPTPEGQSDFRSLMSEMGVVIAPRLLTPADTLGFSGFQFSGEFGMTQISNTKTFWHGVAGVNPGSPTATPPSNYLTTVGGFVRKGMWLPVPALEFGAGAVNVLGSSMVALQGYAKLALQEGFHDWPLPSVAVRGSVSQLLGTDQVDLTVVGLDIVISKAFALAGTARLEPFLGAGYLFIDARSGVIDATPACDAYVLEHTTVTPPDSCRQTTAGAQDYNANFTFPRQSIITRRRFSAGAKIRLGVVFLAAEFDLVTAGTSQDDMQPPPTSGMNAVVVRDQSGQQQAFSLSGGLDF